MTMQDVLSDTVLDALRTIGDPLLEPGPGSAPGAERGYLQLVGRFGIVSLVGTGDPEVALARNLRKAGLSDGDVAGATAHLASLWHRAQDDRPGWWNGDLPESSGHRVPDPDQIASRRPRPVEADERAFRTARELFGWHSTEISGALLLAALPQTYATQWGPKVLVAQGRMVSDFRRRIRGTAEFLLLAMSSPDEPVPWRSAAEASVALRLVHHAVRTHVELMGGIDLGAEGAKAINQEDLLGTLMTFTVTVFEVLERFGIAWTRQDQEAYLRAWDIVGAFLGIGDESVLAALEQQLHQDRQAFLPEGWTTLRPPTIEAARALTAALRRRHWPAVGPWVGRSVHDRSPEPPIDDVWEGLRPGRILVSALLDELSGAMSPRTRALPAIVVRALADPVVRDRLGLGSGGIIQALADGTPRRRFRVDRFTTLESAGPVGGTILRQMANQVTRRSILDFMRDGERPLALPAFAEHRPAGLASLSR
jgi:hypothetical protein